MINFIDFKRKYSLYKKEINKAVEKVFRRGWFILGPELKKFEESFAKYLGVKYVVGVNSGTDAIFLALKVLGIGAGDEVITVANTAVPTVSAISMTGAMPVFVDIDERTMTINVDLIEHAITKKTKAIIVVHYAGVSADMDSIMKIAKKYKLKVIEDAAQAIDSKYKNQFLGTIGDFGCISFHETKNIVCGEGGALFINTNDQHILEKAEIFREKGTNRSKFFRGEIDKYTWVSVGSSILPSDILAAFLWAQLKSIGIINKKRMSIF